MKDVVDLIARILIAGFFFFQAWENLAQFKTKKVKMIEYGLTFNPDLILTASIIFLIIGSILILIGYRSNLGAIMLICYWLPVSLIVHSFWNDMPSLWLENLQMLMKNLGIIGGLLLMFVNGSGRYSIRKMFATTKV